MAYYQKRYRRRRPAKRTWRRRFRSKTIRPLRFTNSPKVQPVHYFIRHVDKGLISGNGSAATHTTGIIHFDLNDVPNYAEYVNMYRLFRICAVKVMFIPIANVTYAAGTLNDTTNWSNNFERLLTCFDYANGTAPSTLDEIREYRNCKVTRNNVIHKRFIYPRPLYTIDEDANTGSNYTYAEGPKKVWITTAGDSCRYFGVKWGFEQQTLSSDPRYRIECKYYLAFKQPK